MAASRKSLLIGAAGVVVAGVVLYLVAFDEGEKKGPAPPAAVESRRAPTDEATSPAVAESSPAAERADVGGLSAASAQGGLEGIVSDESGNPVAGVRIELRKPPPTLRVPSRAPDPLETAGYAAKSGENGAYRLPSPAGEGWKLLASHPQFATTEHSGVSTPPEAFLTFPITMRAGIRLQGRVIEENGQRPVAGARVELDTTPAAPAFPPPVEDRRQATTGAQGEFTFDNLREGRHTLLVHARGYARKINPGLLVSAKGADRVHKEEIRLSPGLTISGRVVDTDGKGVAKANVVANLPSLVAASGEAVAGGGGEFTIEDLEKGSHYLMADAPGYGGGKSEPPQVAAGSSNVVITLAPRGTVAGVVRDKSTGQPLTQFAVESRVSMTPATPVFRGIGPFPVESKDGTFELRGLDPAQAHVVVVTSDTHAPGTSEPFQVQPGQTTRGIEVLVSAGGSIGGTVLAERTGKPVAGATVRTRDNEWRDASGIPILSEVFQSLPSKIADRTVVTDAEGRWEVAHVDAGAVQVEVKHPSFLVSRLRDVQVIEGQKVDAGTIRMLAGGVVRGTVYGSDGKPAANAEVGVRSVPRANELGIHARTVRADAQGRYLVRGLPSGDYTLTPSAGGVLGAGTGIDIFSGARAETRVGVSEGSVAEQDLRLAKP